MRPRVPSLSGRVALYCGLALTAWGYYAYEWRTFANFVAQTDHCQLAFCDFVHVYYPQGQEIGDATQPVDGFVYSAMFAWVLAPIGKLAPDTALTVWGVLQVVLTTLLVVPLSWLFLSGAERFWWRLGYFALCLTSIPLFHSFKWGQVSVLLTLCVIAAAFLQRGRAASVLAGFLMAFAAAIKFYPAVFFLIFLFRKQWLALAAAVILVVLLLALPVWPMGYERSKYFSTAKLVSVIEKEVVTDPNSQYVIRVLAADFPSTFDMKNSIAVLKPAGRAVAVLNILLVFGASVLRIPEESKRRLMVCLLFLMLPFVLTTSWMHYLVYLPFCQICLSYEAARIARDDNRWRMATVWVLAGVSAVLSSIPMVRRQANWVAYVTPGFGFYANLAALLAAYVVMLGSSQEKARTAPLRIEL
jgi:glycosyl transferase family 87